jgi:hypothetical protein
MELAMRDQQVRLTRCSKCTRALLQCLSEQYNSLRINANRNCTRRLPSLRTR